MNNVTTDDNDVWLQTASVAVANVLKRHVTPVFMPFLLIVGLLGNALTVIVIYQSRKLRAISTNHYLAAVSISDAMFLLALVPGMVL